MLTQTKINLPMMSLTKVLSAECVQAQGDIKSRKRALETLSAFLYNQDNAQQDAIFSALLAREKIGSTALGYGMALPHAHLDKLTTPRIALFTLAEPIEFEGAEHLVDLFVGLVVPRDNPEEHLTLLSHITTLLHNEGLRATLREAKDNASLYNAVLMATVVHED